MVILCILNTYKYKLLLFTNRLAVIQLSTFNAGSHEKLISLTDQSWATKSCLKNHFGSLLILQMFIVVVHTPQLCVSNTY